MAENNKSHQKCAQLNTDAEYSNLSKQSLYDEKDENSDILGKHNRTEQNQYSYRSFHSDQKLHRDAHFSVPYAAKLGYTLSQYAVQDYNDQGGFEESRRNEDQCVQYYGDIQSFNPSRASASPVLGQALASLGLQPRTPQSAIHQAFANIPPIQSTSATCFAVSTYSQVLTTAANTEQINQYATSNVFDQAVGTTLPPTSAGLQPITTAYGQTSALQQTSVAFNQTTVSFQPSTSYGQTTPPRSTYDQLATISALQPSSSRYSQTTVTSSGQYDQQSALQQAVPSSGEYGSSDTYCQSSVQPSSDEYQQSALQSASSECNQITLEPSGGEYESEHNEDMRPTETYDGSVANISPTSEIPNYGQGVATELQCKDQTGIVYLDSPRPLVDDNIDDVYAAVRVQRESNFVDFISSLELQSRWDNVRNLEPEEGERLEHQKAFPIASILNDLAFSSDTEDFLPSDADDLLTSDLEDVDIQMQESKTRPSSQVSGKWRPGLPPAKSRGKALPRTQDRHAGKWKPSGKLDAMRKAKDAQITPRHKGKRMSGKLAAMKKLRERDKVTEQGRWRPGERLRATAGTWRPGVRGTRSPDQDLPAPKAKSKAKTGKSRAYTKSTKPQYDTSLQHPEAEDKVVPIDLRCELCEIKLSSHGHYLRHLGSQEHTKRMKTQKSQQCGISNLTTVSEVVQSKPKDTQQEFQSTGLPNKEPGPPAYTLLSEVEDKIPQREAAVECTICVKTFYSKYSFARHLGSNMHLQRSRYCTREMLLDESVQILLLRQSRAQCQVCRFYSTSQEYLYHHMTSVEHCQHVSSLIGPLMCVRCKFVCRKNDEMLSHLQDDLHHQQVQASGRPCIIKESRSRIPCPSCSAFVQSASRLKVHLENCDERSKAAKTRQQPVCAYCDQRLASLYALTLHVRRRHTKERPFKCGLCGVAFADRYTLSLHERSLAHLEKTGQMISSLPPHEARTKKGKYKCRRCDFKAKVYSELRPHYFAKHAGSPLCCELCGVSFTSADDLRQHNRSWAHRRKVKAKDADFSCGRCGKICKDEKRLKLHELSHDHPLTEKELAKLQPAGLIAGINSKHLSFVESIKSLPSIQKVKCPECGKQTARSNIYAHLRMHEGIKVFQCPYCPKTLVSASSLKQHLETHLQIRDHKCDFCNKCFNCQTKLKEHVNTKHTANPLLLSQCKDCDQAFPSAKALHKHRRSHKPVSLKCYIEGCFYMTKHKSDLMVHLKSHSSERNFLCSLCGFRAKHKSSLNMHMKSHSGERRFTCEYCDYKATTGAHLRRHMRIHIGVKPYACPYCEYHCNNLENLHKHILSSKKHPGKPVYPCKLCDFGTSAARDFKNHLVSSHEISYSDIGVLTSYCGIYDRKQDPGEIPEGACAIPVRESKPKSPSKALTLKKSTQKRKPKQPDTPVSPIDPSQAVPSVTLKVSTPVINDQGQTEMREVIQVFPDMEALMQHLTLQGQNIQQETPVTNDGDQGYIEVIDEEVQPFNLEVTEVKDQEVEVGNEEVIIQGNDLHTITNDFEDIKLTDGVTVIFQHADL